MMSFSGFCYIRGGFCTNFPHGWIALGVVEMTAEGMPAALKKHFVLGAGQSRNKRRPVLPSQTEVVVG